MPDQICLTQLSIALSDLWAVIRLLTWQASPDERVACHSLSVFLSLSPSSSTAAGKSAASCSKLSGSFCYYIAWVVPKVVKSQQTKRGATRRRRKNNRKYFALTDIKKCKYAESDAFSLSLSVSLLVCLCLSLTLPLPVYLCLSLMLQQSQTTFCIRLIYLFCLILKLIIEEGSRREREKDRHDCNERERASKRQAEGQ